MKALYIINKDMHNLIYGPSQRHQIEQLVDVYAPQFPASQMKQKAELLESMEILLSGWSCPKLDKNFLEMVPNLKLILYASGSIKSLVSDEFWERDITICSAWAANAIPVSEYTLSQIIFCLKQGWHKHRAAQIEKDWTRIEDNVTGCFGSTVGIISLGMIGRCVCKLLRHFDVKVIAYDPYVDNALAAELGVEPCSLDDIFKRSDVVSLHTPWLKETEKMIQGRHFELMKPNAAFINTSRGAVVDEPEMIKVLKKRTDLQVVLDVTHPEPPNPASDIYKLPNVTLTPHIAGAMGIECHRMAQYMIDELKRYINGESLRWSVTREQAAKLA